jgi:hypothetical protein
MPKIDRNCCVALAVAVCVLFGGGLLFGDSERGMFAVMVATFGVNFTLLELLDKRERRRKQGHP